MLRIACGCLTAVGTDVVRIQCEHGKTARENPSSIKSSSSFQSSCSSVNPQPMMDLSGSSPELVNTSDLRDLVEINSGGFGKIYKARHLVWCCDVAIKCLHFDDMNGSSLLHEVKMMFQGSSPFVIQVLGVFQSQSPKRLGLVMEFMERGSLYSMQRVLQEPPPLPLLFRLAHQVALGINFLHSRTRTILHLDLKPSNVMLDGSLNAKLTDFGLAKVYSSMSQASKRGSAIQAGTINYMPPEAFVSLSYTPTRASDIYSYGILLWSIATGKPPYDCVIPSLVKFHIPKGDRPLLDEINSREELAELKELMVRCWDGSPDQRPSSQECTTETEKLYKRHKYAIHDAVHQVLSQLKQKEAEEQRHKVHFTSARARTDSVDFPENVPTGPMPVQEVADGRPENQLSVKDPSQSASTHSHNRPKTVRPSSVQPIHTPPTSSSSDKIPHDSPGKNHTQSELSVQYQRQHSSPNSHPQRPRINIQLSNVTGLQIGHHNSMHIVERRRHRTAPSRINRSLPQ